MLGVEATLIKLYTMLPLFKCHFKDSDLHSGKCKGSFSIYPVLDISTKMAFLFVEGATMICAPFPLPL